MQDAIDASSFDRVLISSDNAYFHARFALALLAQTEYVAIFDDDSIPGPEWFENCRRLKHLIKPMNRLGLLGVVAKCCVAVRAGVQFDRVDAQLGAGIQLLRVGIKEQTDKDAGVFKSANGVADFRF